MDLVPRDLLRAVSALETYQVHHTTRQEWYFASDQRDDEAWVFLQSDSVDNAMLGAYGPVYLDTRHMIY